MYYVYKISFPELSAIYIGCTNNIRRRMQQHNERARSQGSYLGKFLSREGIKLSIDDLQVIGEYRDRQDALSAERSMIMSLRGTGVRMLNDMYSDHWSRKGLSGSSNPASKEFVVIDVIEHVTHVVRNMRAWCDEHEDVAYKTLVGTSVGKPLMHAGKYIARHLEDWNAMSESERDELVSGRWYKRVLSESEAHRVSTVSHTYLLKTPNGFMFVKNLDKFARDNGINPGNLHATITNGRFAHGYKVVERIA